MLRHFSTRRIVGFFLFDWLGTLGLLLLAASLRTELGNLPAWVIDAIALLGISVGGTSRTVTTANVLFPHVFIIVALVWPLTFISLSVYDGRRNETLRAELRNVLLAICVATLMLAGVLYLTYRETSRVMVVIFFALDVALLWGGRVALWLYRRSQNGRRSTRRRAVVVVGAGSVGQRAVEQLQEYAWPDIELVGYVDDDPRKRGQRPGDLPVLGTLDDIRRVAEAHDVKEAVVALPLRAHKRFVGICRRLQDLGVHVYVIPDLFALSFPSAQLGGFGGIPVVDLGLPSIHGWPRLSKRIFDVVVSSMILLLLSPLLLLVAILIKLESSGPILYRQERIGENGRPFTMFKFRSMRNDTDASAHKAHVTRLIKQNLSLDELGGGDQRSLKMASDPRITRVGRVIRKTSIDELPQLFNVIRGEMSLVGPRPPLPYEVELYEEWHKRRLEALPGITGWWQVRGRNRVSFDEMVRMDLHYIENRSFWYDIKILLLTPRAVVSGKGAG